MQRMAVPFDGVGTLILTNGFDSNVRMAVNDVYWLSATDNFQPGSANPGTQWHQFTVGRRRVSRAMACALPKPTPWWTQKGW